MRTDEFTEGIKKVEQKYGYKFKVYRAFDETIVMLLKNEEPNRVLCRIDEYGSFEYMNYLPVFEDKDLKEIDAIRKLDSLFRKYCDTSINKRTPLEKVKRYHLRHKWMGGDHEYLSLLIDYDIDKPTMEYYIYSIFAAHGLKNDLDISTCNAFTIEEIEKIKKKFNTELKEYEMVEADH